MRLETERLIIRDHLNADLHSMHKLLSDPRAMYFIQDLQTYSVQGTMDNLKTAIGAIYERPRTKFFFRIELRDGSYVGEIGFTVRLATTMGKVVELGYFILPEHWGKGLTTEAADAVVRYAFFEAGVVKVESGCIKDNIASERIMQKIGMVKEADYIMRVWHEGCFKDRVEYRITKQEWEERIK